jgi:hypothetical protein
MNKNVHKWQAAMQWAKNNGFKFKIITEKHLQGKIF